MLTLYKFIYICDKSQRNIKECYFFSKRKMLILANFQKKLKYQNFAIVESLNHYNNQRILLCSFVIFCVKYNSYKYDLNK